MSYSGEEYLDEYVESFDRTRRYSFGKSASPLPTTKEIEQIETSLMSLFFPGNQGINDTESLRDAIRQNMKWTLSSLFEAVLLAYKYENQDAPRKDAEEFSHSIVDTLASKLKEIRLKLKTDAEAGFNGDPAAKSIQEVILCYPALYAITQHRVAHELYSMSVPLIPRMMNEIAHSKTGIDIHPGATIGKSFFIDHGTGVVIGETTLIGENVKLYQGVTLGALSFPKDACGMLLRGSKRHPTIEDNVTIYANATILGDITIGKNSTIASNAWIKENIPPNSRVIADTPDIKIIEKL